MFENSVNIQNRSQKSFATGSQYAERLEPGIYDVWADNDVYLKVHAEDASDVTDATGYLLRAGNTVPIQIVSPAYLGADGTGDVYFHQVK
jgi:hypothetical protein